jgi:hypothetical protein
MMYAPVNASRPPAAPNCRRGYLIDFDYAFVSKSNKNLAKLKASRLKAKGKKITVSAGHRTVKSSVLFIYASLISLFQGTVPFMACAILREPTATHHGPEHDMESLFYVFLWICTHYAGPDNMIRTDVPLDDKIPLLKWCDPDATFLDIADSKVAKCAYANIFEKYILSYFHDYFEDLKECARQLRTLFFADNQKKATHEDMLKIFYSTLQTLLGSETVDTTSEPSSTPLGKNDVEQNSEDQGVGDEGVEDEGVGDEGVEDEGVEDEGVEDEEVEDEGSNGSRSGHGGTGFPHGRSLEDNPDDADDPEYADEDEDIFGIPLENMFADPISNLNDPVLKRKRDDVFAEAELERGKRNRPTKNVISLPATLQS